jgi:pimeloyl-ACP methyl ester carboxylesterase
VLGAALLAAGAVALLGVARRVRRELAGVRADGARVRTGYVSVPSVLGGRGAAASTLRLHARVADEAPAALPPIVLVHGYGIASTYLVPLAARLADRARVYVPDLPGHGRSDRDARPLTVPELADALAAFMDALGLRAAVLVGHSLGCQIVAEAAVRRPALASGLVLVGPAASPGSRTVPRQLARLVAAALFERPSIAVWVARDYWRAGPRLLLAELRALLAHRVEDVLPRATVPVRVVRGAHDALSPQRWAEALARLARAPAPTVVAGEGHAVQYDAPDAVAAAVLSLAELVAHHRRRTPSPPSTCSATFGTETLPSPSGTRARDAVSLSSGAAYAATAPRPNG